MKLFLQVHAFMYSYYALRAARFRVPKPAAMLITALQIAQMVMGVYIGFNVYGIKAAGQPCQQTWENLSFSFLIYASYFLLFCNFFYQAYLSGARGRRRGSEPKTSVQKSAERKRLTEDDTAPAATAQHAEQLQERRPRPQQQSRSPPLTRRRAQKVE